MPSDTTYTLTMTAAEFEAMQEFVNDAAYEVAMTDDARGVTNWLTAIRAPGHYYTPAARPLKP
jgi:hypothetical protein